MLGRTAPTSYPTPCVGVAVSAACERCLCCCHAAPRQRHGLHTLPPKVCTAAHTAARAAACTRWRVRSRIPCAHAAPPRSTPLQAPTACTWLFL